jgi:hypothetical protein
MRMPLLTARNRILTQDGKGAQVIYLLDADMGGVESVQDLIDAGLVKHIPIPTFEAFDKACVELMPNLTERDAVTVDTLGALANTTRGDFRLGTEVLDDLWSKRGLYFGGDKNFLTQYEAAEKLIMRRLRNIRATGASVITTTHEDEQVDGITQAKKRAPKLNQAFYESLMAHSTDVFRLSILHEDIRNAAGETVYTAGTRILYLKASEGVDGHVAKYHVPRSVADTLPRGIVNPDWTKLCNTLHKTPGWAVIYGPPGIGKTSLACSAALITNTAKEATK